MGAPMSLLVVGLSHRSAPVEVLERVAMSCSDTGKVSHQLLECGSIVTVHQVGDSGARAAWAGRYSEQADPPARTSQPLKASAPRCDTTNGNNS